MLLPKPIIQPVNVLFQLHNKFVVLLSYIILFEFFNISFEFLLIFFSCKKINFFCQEY
jgi:hypothetical protein